MSDTTASEDYVLEESLSHEQDHEYIGVIIGTLTALILLLSAVILFIFLRHHRSRKSDDLFPFIPCPLVDKLDNKPVTAATQVRLLSQIIRRYSVKYLLL